MAVGVARGAYEYALDYAKHRQAFGEAIAQRQSIAFMLAEMFMDIEFVHRVAREKMRPRARHYDEHEHEVPWDFINLMWDTALKTGQSFRSGAPRSDHGT